jgi:6-phosphogluconolactonase
VYAINEVVDGGVTPVYLEDFTWSKAIPSHGESPCHGLVLSDGSGIVVSHYLGDVVSFIRLTKGGVGVQTVVPQGTLGPVTARQDGPHPHQAVQDPFTGNVWVCNLGLDALIEYEVTDSGLEEVSRVATPAGFGPRHMMYHPSGHWRAVIGELANEVILYGHVPETTDGVRTEGWVEAGRISTIPPNWHGDNTAAALRWSSDGTRLYASNRGDDSVTVYTLDSGVLTPVQSVPIAAGPRDFALSRDGRWALVAGQYANLVQLLEVRGDGTLGEVVSELSYPAPAALLEVDCG